MLSFQISALALLFQSTTFVLVDRPDPITDKRQVAYAAESDGNMIAVSCSDAASRSISITFVPKNYYGAESVATFWEPNIIYRFGVEKPNNDKWLFYSNNIELGDLLGSNTAKAKFLDQLAKNTVLHIRYEARQGEEKTASFLYQISPQQLSTVVKTCNPKRVQQILREMKSPIETNPN